MNAKEKQMKFIKEYLKPTFKHHGYLTGAQGWWKDRGDFFNAIFWMNSQYNNVEDVTFWFFVGPALKNTLRDPAKKKVRWQDVHYNQYFNFMTTPRRINITATTHYDDFLRTMSTEFETNVLPSFEKLKTLDDWITFYMDTPWNSAANHPADILREKIQRENPL